MTSFLNTAVTSFLNIDAGEHDDEPDGLYATAHAVSIACGGHAGDDRSMRRVLEACKRHGTRAGAHPSYPDRDGFGRREMAMPRDALAASLRDQMQSLFALAKEIGVEVRYVKPHGALYHAAARDPEVAMSLLLAVRGVAVGRTIIGPAGSELERMTKDFLKSPFAREGFADRAMRPDGSLVPRGDPGAVIADLGAVRAQTRALLARGTYDTLCVHGDSPGALGIARAVREVLDA